MSIYKELEEKLKEIAPADPIPLDDEKDSTQLKVDPKPKGKGHLVQYSEIGTGFLPVTRTVSILPPGIYSIVGTNSGTIFLPTRFITDNLLRLPDSKSDEVIREIEHFWTLKDKFTKFGFSHKRGFLLWGPPGSGKTSTIAVVSKQLVDNGGVVIIGNTSPKELSGMLASLREIEPSRHVVVLLEDIDTIIGTYGESETLSLLDGESSIDNVVYVATTNYPEELDGRITNRPSRFDKVVKIDMPSPEARNLYLKSRGIEGDLNKWVELTHNFSIAHIKELIIGVCCFGGKLEDEVKRLRDMSKTPKSGDHRHKSGFDLDDDYMNSPDDYDD